MPEPLLKLLELCLLALVWLFFLRVLRAVWTEVKGPASTAVRPAPSGRRASPVRRRGTPRLVVVEPKDRKGRTLSKDDIAHYQKIVVALTETIRLMKEIDEVIEKHGGWPASTRDA